VGDLTVNNNNINNINSLNAFPISRICGMGFFF